MCLKNNFYKNQNVNPVDTFILILIYKRKKVTSTR